MGNLAFTVNIDPKIVALEGDSQLMLGDFDCLLKVNSHLNYMGKSLLGGRFLSGAEGV